jgi:Flp pilus assembly protein TadG
MVLVLPLLLLVLFGTAEFSRAWLTVNLVTTAAREAARTAAVAERTDFPKPPAARQKVDDLLGAGNWTGDIVCSNPCNAQSDAQVTATVIVPFQTVVPNLLPWLDSLSIQQTVRMRYERYYE